jgi:hypothetical protein
MHIVRGFHHHRRIPPFYIRNEGKSRGASGGRYRPKPLLTPEQEELRDYCKHTTTLAATEFIDPSALPPITPQQVRADLASDHDLRWRVFKRDGYRCLACGADTDLTVDHIVPVTQGGTNDQSNLQTVCRRCNSRKGATTASYLPPSGEQLDAELQQLASEIREGIGNLRRMYAERAEWAPRYFAGWQERADQLVQNRLIAADAATPLTRMTAETRIRKIEEEARADGLPEPGSPRFWTILDKRRDEVRDLQQQLEHAIRRFEDTIRRHEQREHERENLDRQAVEPDLE